MRWMELFYAMRFSVADAERLPERGGEDKKSAAMRDRRPPISSGASPLPSKQRVRDRDVVARNRVELLEHSGSGRSACLGDDRGLMSGAARGIGATLNRQ